MIAVLVAAATACTATVGDGVTTTSSPATTTTTASSTTTEPATTTTMGGTTSTSTESSTTTTTTTTDTSTTTTAAGDGELVLSEGAVVSGGAEVPFGTGVDAAIAAISASLGDPTEDSGWIDAFSVYGTCPLPVVRAVHWEGFIALFTQAETDFAAAGTPHFFSWYYPSGDDIGLETDAGVGIGSTVADLEAAYAGPAFVLTPWEFDEDQGIWSTRQFDVEQLYGFTTGFAPGDTVTAINGGTGCGE